LRWFDGQLDLAPERLVFIDETWASTNMARRYGLTLRGFIAPFVLDGPINRVAFETYVEKVLVPDLREGDTVIVDNLPGHKGPTLIFNSGGRFSPCKPLILLVWAESFAKMSCHVDGDLTRLCVRCTESCAHPD
jgi:hypothetical protein